MMQMTYDPEADAFYARFAAAGTAIADTREVAPGVHIDLDEHGALVGIEVLDVSPRGQEPVALTTAANAAAG